MKMTVKDSEGGNKDGEKDGEDSKCSKDSGDEDNDKEEIVTW